jgi:glycosyltransferase involved in cell wall biosynthesis
MTNRLRVAVCADFREEGWPSMDRVADQLLVSLARDHRTTIDAASVCPPFRRRATRVSSGRAAWNVDRGLNRLIDYPRHVQTIESAYDVFHVVDHSYSQLVRRLPVGRTIVTCHDLDTFRSIFEPDAEPRPPLFRAMTRHILAGLEQAACVTCDTAAIRDALVARGCISAERVVVVPVGVGAEFQPDAEEASDREAARLVNSPASAVEILHVGSNVARKRIDDVLHCVAEVRRQIRDVRLVRVGGPFTAAQADLARALGLTDWISMLPPLDDKTLAAVYRRAAVVILASEREGFGLPVIEAFACGAPVVASDLGVLREVGGTVAEFCRVGDRAAFAQAMAAIVRERLERPERAAIRRTRAIARAQRFTWAHFAGRLATIYLELARATESARAPRFEQCLA